MSRFGARKFNISRLTRFKVTYRATKELYGQSKNFDHFVAFDKAKCTVPLGTLKLTHVLAEFELRPGCSMIHWDPLGYVLGCTLLGRGFLECLAERKNDPGRVALPGEAAWYSLPGTVGLGLRLQTVDAISNTVQDLPQQILLPEIGGLHSKRAWRSV